MDTHNNVLILGGGVEWVEAEECIGVINANEKHTKNELLKNTVFAPLVQESY